MRYLLFPEEERTLIRHLQEELGLQFLASNVGAPLDADPIARISDDFPILMSSEERVFYFWCSDIGPVQRLGDAPPPQDAKGSVGLHLSREANPEGWKDLIDLSRTPVLSWWRPKWYNSDRKCVVAGRLGATTAMGMEFPVELRRLHQSVDRWLRKPAIKINPFAHCSTSPVPEPKNLSVFWVAAWPQGKRWVDQGGELWPWDG